MDMAYSCTEYSVSSPSAPADYKKDYGSFFVFEGSFDSTRPLDQLENVINSPLPATDRLDTVSSLGVVADQPVLTTNAIVIPTPPPEGSALECSLSPVTSPLSHYSAAASDASEYIKGSSLEESPISSPVHSNNSSADGLFIVTARSKKVSLSSSTRGSVSDSLKEEDSPFLHLSENENQYERTSEISLSKKFSGELATENAATGRDGADSHPVEEEIEVHLECTKVKDEIYSVSPPNSPHPLQSTVPRNIKLPQRKGGMQLWQFLYALLGDSAINKYGKLIEWTANQNSREFRLLEPEAIAIWWGEHKNKKNMSYDKLSRSLRYYYDKGIIRKIPGERYVYQFCIDPEMMYKHIGNSDCRPKLKPMPLTALRATSDYQLQHSYSAPVFHKEPLFITQGPIMMHNGMSGAYPLSSSEISFPPPDYPGHCSYPSPNYYDNVFASTGVDMYNSSPMTPPTGGGLDFHPNDSVDVKPLLSMRKCHSFESGCMYASESDDLYRQSLGSAGGFPGTVSPSIYPFGPPPPPLHTIPHSHTPSSGTSPLASTFSQRSQFLDELIEPASCELQASHHTSIYSPCEDTPPTYTSRNNTSPVVWSFN